MIRAALWLVFLALATSASAERFSLTIELGAAVPYRVTALPASREILVTLTAENGMPAGTWPFRRPAEDLAEVEKVTRMRGDDGSWQLALTMRRPYRLVTAALRGRALALELESDETIAALDRAAPPDEERRPPLIVLDPGHGGIDSGAVRGEHRESDLMLIFARELAEALVRSGRFRVLLTREGDDFLRLSERVGVARDAQAEAFLSLHADVVSEGRARGASIYTLSRRASDAAAAELVEAHARADLLSGQDLTGADDDIASVLVDMAQAETAPRSTALARALINALREGAGKLRKEARRSADFGVLKAPDIPSVLIELGFMSDKGDLKNLADPDWRATTAAAIRDGLIAWREADIARRLSRD